ncbi:MAG: 2-dehydropantoate 2-reductase [Akkermansiaceae bacterium]|nr:2-dehydropantoate 2-reductase [Akkermansiaceae bacterium]
MNIAILGAGALGCYYGARLAEAGHRVTFIMRSAYEPVSQRGLQVNSIKGDICLPHPRIARHTAECGPVDLVIVSWKTTCNHLLEQELPALLHAHTRVLTFQNGMGNAEAIAQIVPAERVFIGLCFVCVMMDTPGIITHLEKGDIQFAPYTASAAGLQTAQELADLFAGTPIKTSVFMHAEQILWCKLSWNIPFNGLCLAHGGISIRQLFTMPQEVERARRIMNEVYHTAELRGFPLPTEIVQEQMRSTAAMGDFIPSSAVDYNRNRPVEYEAIWGTPLRLALAAGAPVPEWQQLAADIRKRLTH